MTRREKIWFAAYGAAFSDAMRRGLHGQTRTTASSIGEAVETVVETIDAKAEAARWATTCADAAARSVEREP